MPYYIHICYLVYTQYFFTIKFPMKVELILQQKYQHDHVFFFSGETKDSMNHTFIKIIAIPMQ